MKLIWSRESRNDIRRLYQFLVDKNPKAARQAILSIKEKADYLNSFPETGKSMQDGSGRQELHVRFGSYGYVIRYRIKYQTDQVRVLRVWHTKERR